MLRCLRRTACVCAFFQQKAVPENFASGNYQFPLWKLLVTMIDIDSFHHGNYQITAIIKRQ